MTLEDLKILLAIADNPKAMETHPWQVWEDGEATLQKGGDLLWCRTLHCIKMGFGKSLPLDLFPEKNRYNGHAYVWLDSEKDVNEVRHLIEVALFQKEG